MSGCKPSKYMATLFLCSLVSGFTAAALAQDEPEPWTTEDIIDERIDENAQYALMRMMSGEDLATAATASAILSAVKADELAGIYQADREVPALRARAQGGNWWEIVPAGADAICWLDGGAPMIVYRKSLASAPARVDAALMAAWSGCGLAAAEPRAYRVTLHKPPPEPEASGDLPAPPSGLTVIVLSGGAPLAGATVDVNGAISDIDVTGDDGTVVFEASPGIAELFVSGPTEDYSSAAREVTIPTEGGTSVTIELDLETAEPVEPSEPEAPTCDEDKYSEVFDACGKDVLGGAMKCLKDPYVGYVDCARKRDPVCAGKLLKKFWDCKSELDHKRRINECVEQANLASNCDFAKVQ